MPPIIASLKNVGVCYKKRYSFKENHSKAFWALKDVTLNIHQGESIGIYGKNGAGKSTLLRVLAGLILPNKGTAFLAKHYHASLLNLQSGFNSNLNGVDNAILKGLFLGVKKEYIKNKIPEIMTLSGLGEAFYDPIRTYSSGMVARLGFAVNYYCMPDLLLIDETLGVGDKEFKQQSQSLIYELIRSDKTVVIVSHDENLLKSLTNKIYIMEQGVLFG